MKKQNLKTIVALVLVQFLLSGSLFSQTKVGISAATFLGIGAGPKALSQGSSMVATASDASTIYWNPGAAAQLDRNQVVFSNTNWFLNTELNFFAATFNLGRGHTIGIGYYNLDYGREEVTTATEQSGTGEYWSASDMTFSVTYARLLTDRFSLGGSVKYIQSKIWHESARAFAVDVGLLFKTQLDGLRIGMSISNYGTEMQYTGSDIYEQIDLDDESYGNNETITAMLKTDEWALPLYFRIGLAYTKDLTNYSKITLSSDALVPSDNEEQLNLGLEWEFFNQFALRAGYKALGYTDSQEGLTLGGGIKYRFNNLGLMLDYSYQEFEYFNNVQTFGIGLIF